MEQPAIKIFISSPGDVLYERQIARRIIARLAKEFSASAKLEALLWEDMPLQVTSSFQEGIDQIINVNLVDIAVFILWSRLGTPLSEKFVKADGSRYQSGTEYEFDMMYAANQLSGVPSILAYIKNAPITGAIFQSSAGANIDFEEIGKQQKEAQRFIREKFYDPETKTVYGAYHQFEAPTTFEQKLTEHLRHLIINIIGHEALIIEWEGNPYVGLRSFRYDENAIFYGRRHTINAIEEKFARWLPDKAPCLFVLGESGSGKSSLVRAGLLPDMIEFGWVENTKWKWFDVMPGQFRGNLYNGMLSKLVDAFPVLNEKAIGKDLLMGKEVNFGHLSDILPHKTDEAVLFFIDQFEEIFTDPLITEEERIRTFGLLRGMAATQKIWMIFSMRNDFYHRLIAYPALSEFKNNSIVYDLPKILHSELQEIIEEPAKKAGLKWETKEQGMTLNKTIIHDISSGVDDLPLIEFALSELYNLRDENNMLTYKAYEDIGKIDGAVVKYVDNFYNTLTEKEKELFFQILSALIAPSVENKNYVRKTALLRDLQKTEIHRQLLVQLINRHILISGKDENDEATVNIVHEILISSWKIIQDWIEQEKYFINANNHYVNLSKYWIEHDKSKNDLLQGAAAIKESEYFLYSWKNNCSANVKDFLFAFVKKEKRVFLPWVWFFLLCTGIPCIVFCVKFIFTVKFDADKVVVLSFLMITLLLLYVMWKKIKAVPKYETINVSLIFWSVFFILSVLFHLIWDWWKIWIFCALLLPKLGWTIIEKREMMQWKRRIFKRRFSFLTVFMDNSSQLLQKTLRIFIWVVSGLLIFMIASGSFYIVQFIKKVNSMNKSYETVYEVLDKLNNISLSSGDRIFFNRKQIEILQGNNSENRNINMSFKGRNLVSGKFNYRYAFLQYQLGHPEEFLPGIQENLKTKYMKAYNCPIIKAAFEMGMFDDCRTMLELYKNQIEKSERYTLDEIDNETIFTAEKTGLFELAKEITEHREKTDDCGALQIYKAHALLMTGGHEQALTLYRQLVREYKNNIEKDFAIFRWLGFPDTEIATIEKDLRLDKISVYTHPDDDNNTALAAPFTGKWQYGDNDNRIGWEIKENYNLCHYLFQTKHDGENWLDDDIAVTRYRIKQSDYKTFIEEYNVRTNELSVSEITLVNDDELRIKPAGSGEMKVYRRMK